MIIVHTARNFAGPLRFWRYCSIAESQQSWTKSSGLTGLDMTVARLRCARRVTRPNQNRPSHIDGLPSPFNGVPSSVLVSNFTALIGIYLSPVRTEFSGNFTVWPGSHHILEAHFRELGRKALRNGMPRIPLGEPVQLMTEPGDVALCHYGLAHTAAVNLSAIDRCAVYFRLWLKRIGYRRWHFMTHIWDGWRI